MIKKKIKLYYKSFVSKTFEKIHGKVLLKKNTLNLFNEVQIKDPLFKSYENKKYNIYKVKNGRIFTDNNENVAVIKNNILIPKLSFQQVNGKLEHAKYNSVIRKGTPSILKKFSGTVLNLAQGASGHNYFHFIFDIIPKIYLVKKKIKNKINFYYVSAPKKWQIGIFKILGIKENKLISSSKNKHIIADQIICLDHPWYHKGIIQDQVKKVPKWVVFINRKIFLKEGSKFKCSKKIFLDRIGSRFNHCQIFDQKQINKWIKKKGLSSYKPEKLSFQKQIYLFKNASVILGAHGAAFTNIIFCKPGTKIIELIPEDHPNRKCERLSKILKLKHFRIVTKSDNSNKNFPFRIHLEKKHLKMIDEAINL